MVAAGFLLRRFATALVVLFGVTLITFTISHLLPVNPLTTWLGKNPPNQELVRLYTRMYHLDEPIYIQYFYYLNGLLHLQLGYSPTRGEFVIQAIRDTLPYTLQLLILSVTFTFVLTVVSSLIAAKYAGGIPDILVRIFYFTGWAAPSFFIALVLIVLFAYFIAIFPVSGPMSVTVSLPPRIIGIPIIDSLVQGDWATLADLLYHAILPSLAITLGLFGASTRVLRSSIIENLNLNFVRAAKARGLSENSVLFNYAFKGALVTLVSLFSTLIPSTLSGVIFVESIFAYPGIGQYAVQAALALDYPSILGTTLVFAIIIVITNLIADILYSIVDPRIRYG